MIVCKCVVFSVVLAVKDVRKITWTTASAAAVLFQTSRWMCLAKTWKQCTLRQEQAASGGIKFWSASLGGDFWWGWSHWAEPELKAGCATGGLEIYEACAVPPQATAGETKREPALCGQLQPSAKGSRERRRAGDCRWEEAGGVKREESALCCFRTTTQETHTCVNHQRFSPVTLCDLWPGMCSWVPRK